MRDPLASSSVAIGTFDGVHLGHRTLIGQAVQDARQRGIGSVAITWDRHPSETLRPERTPALLSTLDRKLELLAETGVATTLVIAFDQEFSQWPPERFVKDVLVTGLGAAAVFVGAGWRFGHRAAGTTQLLADLGADLGFESPTVDLQVVEGAPVSSSRVRAAVANGDMQLAHILLGRPFDFDGEVIRGDDRGKSLGFPTANVALDDRLAHPPRGVYACRASVVDGDQPWYLAATNVGVNPTFGGDPETSRPRIEAYLLDFESDLYGKTLRVEFHQRLRDELRFESSDGLVTQMHADVAQVRELLAPLQK